MSIPLYGEDTMTTTNGNPTEAPADMTEIYILGSWGHLRVNAATGDVLEYVWEDRPEYTEIVRIDVGEYQEVYGKVEDADILDVGYWTRDGSYEPPMREHWDETEEEIEHVDPSLIVRVGDDDWYY